MSVSFYGCELENIGKLFFTSFEAREDFALNFKFRVLSRFTCACSGPIFWVSERTSDEDIQKMREQKKETLRLASATVR